MGAITNPSRIHEYSFILSPPDDFDRVSRKRSRGRQDNHHVEDDGNWKLEGQELEQEVKPGADPAEDIRDLNPRLADSLLGAVTAETEGEDSAREDALSNRADEGLVNIVRSAVDVLLHWRPRRYLNGRRGVAREGQEARGDDEVAQTPRDQARAKIGVADAQDQAAGDCPDESRDGDDQSDANPVGPKLHED